MIRALIAAAAVGLVGLGWTPTVAAEPHLFGPIASDDLPASPMSQQNAVRKAQDYLSFSAFSRSGLLAQLQYDGFTPSQAAYGVAAAYG